MSNHFIVPTFNKSTRNKVHNKLVVTGQNALSLPIRDGGWLSTIATESIPATVDGEYVFVVRIDNIGRGFIMIGLTPMETFDSSKESCPGLNGMTGCAWSLCDGNYNPGNSPNLINSAITKKAKEVIVVVSIANNGAKKFIRLIVDGTSSVNHDCSADCNGNKLFPVVSMFLEDEQISTIPIDQITIRNDEVNNVIKKFSKQSSSSQGAVANNNQQQSSSSPTGNPSNVAVANNNQQQTSSAAFAQLQQELGKERKRADLAEAQLRSNEKQLQHEKQRANACETQLQQKDLQLLQKDQQLERKDHQLHDEKTNAANLMTEVKQKDQQLQQQSSEVTQLKQQLLTLQSQLNNNSNSLVPSSPFVKDKLYQIDFAVNGITPPADPNAFGTLLKLPSQNNSALFQHVKNELWKKLGTMIPTPKGVYDFTLESIEVIYSEISSLETRMRRLQQLRSQNGSFFNPPTGAFTAEQLQTLIALRDQFLPRPSNADPKSPNLINVFHGTKIDRLQSVVNGLVAVRSTDAGYFGSGVYTTTSIEYAAKYAKGDFDFKNGPYPPRASDGCIPVVWCVAAVGVCYPLTREVDYSKKRVHDGMDVSDFFGMPLAKGYDCHCVAVNESVGFQAVPRDKMQYMKIVFDQEAQVLPIAVLWMKPV